MSIQELLEADFVSTISSEEIFKKIKVWLKFERVTIIEEKAPYHIRAIWKGNVIGSDGYSGLGGGGPFLANALTPNFLVNDPYEKDITVNIRDYGGQSTVSISILQTDKRHGDKGFVYWGMRLENLYKTLDVQPNKIDLLELYPSNIIRREIRKVLRDYFLLLSIPTVIVLYIFGIEWDKLFTYSFMFIIPLTILFGSKYQIYRSIYNRVKRSI